MAPRDKAKQLVEDWKNRKWLNGAAPLHVHPLDLAKLEEMIEAALSETPKAKAS